MAENSNNYPESIFPNWTKRVFTETTGRDPLGLSRVANMITDYLLTGIITTTNRARYYSFFPWALWHIANFCKVKDFGDFSRELRNRESMLALSTIHVHPSTSPSPVGVRVVNRRLKQYIQQKIIDLDFQLLPSNILGAYGQIYGSSLNLLGLTTQTETGIDFAQPTAGERIAKLFQQSVSQSSIIKENLFQDHALSINKFEESAPFFSLDALMDKNADLERKDLIRIFFGLPTDDLNDRQSHRRETLLHILYTISEYEKKGSLVNIDEIDWCLVYPSYYYDVLWLEDFKTVPIEYPNRFSNVHVLWRQFCLQQFLTVAFEQLFCAMLDIAGRDNIGITKHGIVDALCCQSFTDQLCEFVGEPVDTPLKLLNALGICNIPDSNSSILSQRQFPLLHPLSEVNITIFEASTPEKSAAAAIMLFAILFCKWRGMSNEYGHSFVAEHAGNELWAGTTMHLFDDWIDPQITWHSVIDKLAIKFILRQHDTIVYEKQRLDCSWFDAIEGRLVKLQDYEPSYRSSRHYNATVILRDLSLLNIKEGAITISSEGLSLLKEYL